MQLRRLAFVLKAFDSYAKQYGFKVEVDSAGLSDFLRQVLQPLHAVGYGCTARQNVRHIVAGVAASSD